MTKRISNKLSNEQARIKVMNSLTTKGHIALPDMDTYTAYNSPIRMYCNGCNLDEYRKFNNVVSRGCRCTCTINAEAIAKQERQEAERKYKEDNKFNIAWLHHNYHERITNACPNLIPLAQTYTKTTDNMRMYCTLCESIIDKRPNDAISGHNCYNCFGTSFNKGITGYLYILRVTYEDVLLGYKFGITNKLPSERCRVINAGTNLECTVIYSYESLGENVQRLESYLRNNLPRGYISKELMKDGSTETFNPSYLAWVVGWLYRNDV